MNTPSNDHEARARLWHRELKTWHRLKYDVVADAMALADREVAAAVAAVRADTAAKIEGRQLAVYADANPQDVRWNQALILAAKIVRGES